MKIVQESKIDPLRITVVADNHDELRKLKTLLTTSEADADLEKLNVDFVNFSVFGEASALKIHFYRREPTAPDPDFNALKQYLMQRLLS